MSQRALTPLPGDNALARFPFRPLRPPHALLVFVLIQTCGSCCTGVRDEKKKDLKIYYNISSPKTCQHVIHLWVPIDSLIVIVTSDNYTQKSLR